MKKVIVILISILLLILDNSFSPFIAVKGAAPSLLFIFAVGYSIIYGKEEAVFIGVVSGLLQDIYFFNGFGINLLLNMLICFCAGVIGEGIWRERRLIPVISTFIASIIKYYLVMFIFYFMNIKIDSFRGISIAVYNSLLMIVFYGFAYKIATRDNKQKSWRVK